MIQNDIFFLYLWKTRENHYGEAKKSKKTKRL